MPRPTDKAGLLELSDANLRDPQAHRRGALHQGEVPLDRDHIVGCVPHFGDLQSLRLGVEDHQADRETGVGRDQGQPEECDVDGAKKYQSVDEYIADQPTAVRVALETVRGCILEAVPDAEQLFNYDIPAFTLVKGGKREHQIMIAGYAKHIGFYPHPTTIEAFSTELAQYRYAKGSVQFPLSRPMPRQLIIRMVRWRKEHVAE